jgi:hypothetical protein
MNTEPICTSCGRVNATPQYGEVCIPCLSAAWDNGKAKGLEVKRDDPSEVRTGQPEWYRSEE